MDDISTFRPWAREEVGKGMMRKETSTVHPFCGWYHLSPSCGGQSGFFGSRPGSNSSHTFPAGLRASLLSFSGVWLSSVCVWDK